MKKTESSSPARPRRVRQILHFICNTGCAKPSEGGTREGGQRHRKPQRGGGWVAGGGGGRGASVGMGVGQVQSRHHMWTPGTEGLTRWRGGYHVMDWVVVLQGCRVVQKQACVPRQQGVHHKRLRETSARTLDVPGEAWSWDCRGAYEGIPYSNRTVVLQGVTR